MSVETADQQSSAAAQRRTPRAAADATGRRNGVGEARLESIALRLNSIFSSSNGPDVFTEHTQRDRRYPYKRPGIDVIVKHPGGTVARVPVFCCNVSAGGCGFLYGGFLYPGSTCTIGLPDKATGVRQVPGVILHCRHVESGIHYIGMRFRERINPEELPPESAPPPQRTADTLALTSLQGRVLYIDDSEMDRVLLGHHLRNTGISLLLASSAAEARQAMQTSRFDIVLCDLNLGAEGDGVELVRWMRQRAFRGPVVMITAENNVQRLEEVKVAGATHILFKPYEPRRLMELVVRIHQQVGAICNPEPVYSTLADQPGIGALLVGYLEQTAKLIERLQIAADNDQVAEVREVCLNLKGSATGYGYGGVTQLAAEAVKALDSGSSVQDVRPLLRRLILLCGRLAAARPAPPSAA